jgi:uncharacterized FlaG/YvyC family protein
MRKFVAVLVMLVVVWNIGTAVGVEITITSPSGEQTKTETATATPQPRNSEYASFSDEELKTRIDKISEELEYRNYVVDISITKNTISSYVSEDSPIEIYSASITDVNSVGGVDVQIVWHNISDKTMKYVTFNVIPYNHVRDIIYSEVGNRSSIGLRVTGPIDNGEPYYYYDEFSRDYLGGSQWETVWYNGTIWYFKITSIDIIYMDNSTQTINNVVELGFVSY